MTDKKLKTYEIPLWKDGELITRGPLTILPLCKAEEVCKNNKEPYTFSDFSALSMITREAINQVITSDSKYFSELKKGSYPLTDIVLSNNVDGLENCCVNSKTKSTKVKFDVKMLLDLFKQNPKLTPRDKQEILHYFMAYGLEHALQIKKINLLSKDKESFGSSMDVNIVLEADAIAVALVKAHQMGISPCALKFLQDNCLKDIPNVSKILSTHESTAQKEKKLTLKVLHSFEKFYLLQEKETWSGYDPKVVSVCKHPDVFVNPEQPKKPLARLTCMIKSRSKLRG